MIIDNLDFANKHQVLNGEIDIENSLRITDNDNPYRGKLKFELHGIREPKNKPFINGRIYGRITALCQICLTEVEIDISHSFNVQIFNSEEALNLALFDEDHPVADGIVKDPEFNVLEFIEDEIIMSLPLAPKHDKCQFESLKDSEANPFAVLKKLK